MRWPLGVVSIAYGDLPPGRAAEIARRQSFEHLDVVGRPPAEKLALPIGDCFSYRIRPGCTSGPQPEGVESWEDLVAAYRAAPGARLEPWPDSLVGDTRAVLAFLDEVPGLRLTVDVGHVVGWGGDPLELLPFADHVQLRQARPGQVQARTGDVDFAAVLGRLAEIEYAGRLSVEYFDLPNDGFPFHDPVGAALETAAQIRALM